MKYSCKTVVGHGQKCEPNYQCDACAAKQKYIPRIEKLEAALREIENEINSPDDDFPLAFGCMRMIINNALEGKDD